MAQILNFRQKPFLPKSLIEADVWLESEQDRLRIATIQAREAHDDEALRDGIDLEALDAANDLTGTYLDYLAEVKRKIAPWR